MKSAAWLAVYGKSGHTEYMCDFCENREDAPYLVCPSCKRKMMNSNRHIKIKSSFK